jgi:putative tricarboxylic transport membrane protein
MGQNELFDGVPLLAVIMGFYGISDVLLSAGRRHGPQLIAKIERLNPSMEDMKVAAGPTLRGTVIGFLFGLVPGMVAAVSSFGSYAAEKRIAKDPSRFGKGALEGVVGPEAANKSFEIASFVPLFTLGIPGSAALAILMSAFMIQGVTPGPTMFTDAPDVAWGVIASMVVGNVILLVLNFPLVRIWVQILKIPADILGVLVIAISIVGIYSVNRSIYDVMLLGVFALLGCLLKLLDFPLAPAVLAFVLGDKIEAAFRQSLILAHENPLVFITRPISGTVIAIAIVTVVILKIRRSKPAPQTV